MSSNTNAFSFSPTMFRDFYQPTREAVEAKLNDPALTESEKNLCRWFLELLTTEEKDNTVDIVNYCESMISQLQGIVTQLKVGAAIVGS